MESIESMDTKEHKLQDPTQRQPAQTPDTCPNARRGKRMKCEVSVVEECHKHLAKTVQEQAVQTSFFTILHTHITILVVWSCPLFHFSLSPQAICVKTEPGEPGENKPNLRRRMGSFVAKQEPGQAPHTRVKK